jgi:uncharacterized iron-regulated protein
MLASAADARQPPCQRPDGTSLRDEFWRHAPAPHPLTGQVIKDGKPISVRSGVCSPLEQLIVEVWEVVRGGGIALLGEVHDNPEHHRVRGDILWPRLEPRLATRELRPAAVFEHIRTSQLEELDHFYAMARRSRRLWRAADLLRVLGWERSGWPQGRLFEPLFDAALRARLPILPGTAPRERVRGLARAEAADIAEAEAASLALARSMPEPLVAALEGELQASHCGIVPGSGFATMSLAQRYTDAHMAGRLVEAAERHGGAFLLAGNGHVRTDRGVAWHLRRLAPHRTAVAVLLLEVEDGRLDAASYMPRAPDGARAADYVLLTPRQPRADPCEKLRQRRP